MNATRRQKNVLGGKLVLCGFGKKTTGFYRNGYCTTGYDDTGTHVVCAVVTDKFLQFSKNRNNDLITPRNGFPGLKEGDKWCLCAYRWKEAYEAGVAPPVILESTSMAVKRIVPLSILKQFATPRRRLSAGTRKRINRFKSLRSK
jgi:uncharacterized protein (DUF2237 family)